MRQVLILLTLALLLTTAIAVRMITQVTESRQGFRAGDGKNPETYGFALDPLLIPVEELVASGVPRGSIRGLDLPPIWTTARIDSMKRDRPKYLVPGDRIAGVLVNGRARAYPLQILEWHEVVNDTVGGVPIAVTYAPLADAVAAFERPVGFARVSGLLHDSGHLIYFDPPEDSSADGATRDGNDDASGARAAGSNAPALRAESNAQRGKTFPVESQSLWSPMLGIAISGPAAAGAESLAAVPLQVVSWETWRARHPETTVLSRDPARTEIYKRRPYTSYFGNDELRFPASPLPSRERIPYKDPVVVVEAGGERRVYPLQTVEEHADPRGIWETQQNGVGLRFFWQNGNPATVWVEPIAGGPWPRLHHSAWFAWYSTHPEDPVQLP